MHILHILCIFCIFCAYHFAYHYCAYFAYIIACILRIFCILSWFCIFDAYNFAYYFAYSYAYYHVCILCTLCILYNDLAGTIVHIVHTLDEKVIHMVFIFYCHYCLVPHPRAQLFTYHHLQPSPLFCWFIAESSGKFSRFSTHGEGYCPCRTHRNKRKASQYGGHWNHLQNLCLFTAFVDDCRLTLPALKHRRTCGTAC